MSGTNIFIVPMGPKFDFNTSCRPSPALMLTLRASPLLYGRLATFSVDFWILQHTLDSAFGFRSCAADIARDRALFLADMASQMLKCYSGNVLSKFAMDI